ncbi:MAG: hypothetical protein CR986_02900 [Ignavibacteriae bacterium]|nr:MAG: hypothetical protein CR986_02900 [Ignavibacteriota bacterium]
MTKKSEPWYIHAVLYVIIAVLIYVLIRVAIIDPTEHIEKEKYNISESHLRMDNIRQAQILWQQKNSRFTDRLDSLIDFVKTDSTVHQLMVGVDTLTNRSTNPFKKLSKDEFNADSLFYSPATHSKYVLQVDTTITIDTVVTPRGKIKGIDTTIVIGNLYYLECPDGYGSIGSLESQARKNAASWE